MSPFLSYSKPWQIREWRRDGHHRLRLSTGKYYQHCDFLGALIDRVERRLARLPAGIYPSSVRTYSCPCFSGSVRYVATRLVLEKERDYHYLHHATKRSVCPSYVHWQSGPKPWKDFDYYGQDCPSDNWIAFVDGRLIVDAPPERQEVIRRLEESLERLETHPVFWAKWRKRDKEPTRIQTHRKTSGATVL